MSKQLDAGLMLNASSGQTKYYVIGAEAGEARFNIIELYDEKQLDDYSLEGFGGYAKRNRWSTPSRTHGLNLCGSRPMI